MRIILERLANELPSIAVGVWAALRVAGIDIDQADQQAILEIGQTVGAALLWLLARRNIDGPVTALKMWHANRDPDAEANLRRDTGDDQ